MTQLLSLVDHTETLPKRTALQFTDCYRTSGSAAGLMQWHLSRDLTVRGIKSGGVLQTWTLDSTKPARLSGGTSNDLDSTHHSYVLFGLPGDSQVYAIEQENWPALVALTDAAYLCWTDAQYDLVPRMPRQLAVCFAAVPTIRLVASGLQGPQGMCLGTDGLVYFSDGSVPFGTGSIRTYNPATDAVTTILTTSDLNDLLIFFTIVGIARDADGNLYLDVLSEADNPFPQLYFLAAGFTTAATAVGYGGNTSTYPYTVFASLPNEEPVGGYAGSTFGLQRPTSIHFNHDFSKLYIPSQWSPTGSGLGGQYGAAGTGMVIYLNIADGLYYSLAGIAVDLTSGGTLGYSFSPDSDLLTENSQGENVPALGGMVGNVCDVAVHPVSGDIVTIANDVGMVRLIAADGSTIKSLSNHSANHGGSFTTPDYFGDGGPAFTTPNASRPLFNNPQSVAFNKCLDVIIADTGNAVLRRIDGAGLLSTVAGNGLTTPLPTSTPVLGTLAAVPANFLQTLADGSILIADTSNGNLYRLS